MTLLVIVHISSSLSSLFVSSLLTQNPHTIPFINCVIKRKLYIPPSVSHSLTHSEIITIFEILERSEQDTRNFLFLTDCLDSQIAFYHSNPSTTKILNTLVQNLADKKYQNQWKKM